MSSFAVLQKTSPFAIKSGFGGVTKKYEVQIPIEWFYHFNVLIKEQEQHQLEAPT